MPRKKKEKPVVDEVLETVDEGLIDEEKKQAEDDDWKKILRAYEDYVVEDEEFVEEVGRTAVENIFNDFNINFSGNDRDDGYKMPIMIFIKTFEQIIAELQSHRTTMSSFEINIADRLVIGYSNNNGELLDDEKQGNFMIYVQDLGHYIAPDDEMHLGGSSREYISAWNQENMVKQPETLNRIAAKTTKVLAKELDIQLLNHEFVFPIFITVYDTLVNIIKVTRRELKEDDLMVNFCNCFLIRAMEQDSGVDKIIITPSIESKMALKSDMIATSIYE